MPLGKTFVGLRVPPLYCFSNTSTLRIGWPSGAVKFCCSVIVLPSTEIVRVLPDQSDIPDTDPQSPRIPTEGSQLQPENASGRPVPAAHTPEESAHAARPT